VLEVAAPLAKIESPCEMGYCNDQVRGEAQAQTGIELTLDDRLVGGSCDLVADTTGGAVWEVGVAVEPGMAFHNRKICWDCKVLAV
jgi:hypothetical protein